MAIAYSYDLNQLPSFLHFFRRQQIENGPWPSVQRTSASIQPCQSQESSVRAAIKNRGVPCQIWLPMKIYLRVLRNLSTFWISDFMVLSQFRTLFICCLLFPCGKSVNWALLSH